MSHLSEYSSYPIKKSKTSRACDICRKKKVKCDGTLPACSHCATFGFDCTFAYKPKKRGPNPSQQKLLESRLERLETLILPLVEEEELKERLSKASGKPRPLRESLDASHEEEVEEDNTLSKISQNFSNLVLEGNNSFRYVGSSSGLYVLEGGKFNRDGLVQDLRYHLDNFGSIPQAFPKNFPFQELTSRLLSIYFDRFHRYVPIFNKVDLQDRISSGKKVSLTLMNSIYALACLHIQMDDLFDDAETHVSATNYFFTQAKICLHKEYLIPSVQTVQALILMSFHPEGGWIFLGMAVRIGQELGLHRNLDLDKMDSIQKQNRQLAWWGCFFFDRLVGAIVGRPMCIDEEDCDVKLPIDIRSKGSDKNPREDKFAGSVRYFNQIIRLFTILTQILRTVYGVTKQSKVKARDTLLHLNKSLSDWNATLPPEFWYDITLGRSNNHYAAMLALHYHYAVILANRPYIAPSGDNISLFNNLALQTCAKSASIISYILYHIPASNLLHGIQIKSTFIFCASTIHTMNITSSDSNLSSTSKTNLIVNLNILKKLNIHAKALIRSLLYVQDMVQSHGLSDMVSDSQQPVIYSSANEQLSTTDYLASPPSRHDSETLVFQPQQTSTDVLTTPEHCPHFKSSSSPSASSSPIYLASSTGSETFMEPDVDLGGDTGKSHLLVNGNSSELAVNNTENLENDSNENSNYFDSQQWNVFISMFNQSQLPQSNTGK
ncbi:hypothetical protein K7432_009858 [Basidiobolus ranarum]|uniref:Zn(2)-C6 fungal-type domain-containing protein n=1 Tax=Basidiobolus ranarum TaxID=34480 RepID=A0ABR2WPL1_9FUNG